MKKLLLLPFLFLLLYALGPSPQTPEFSNILPNIPSEAEELENYVRNKEARHKIKPGNEAEIIWANHDKKKTKVALVYLHGFSASKEEGDPIHRDFAYNFNCNAYFARLEGHGIDTSDALYNITADGLYRSAKEAYAIGKQLGDEVVIMSTSTGGTLALKLAAEFPEIKGLINFSPNMAINDPAAFLLNDPWGLQIAQVTFGGKYRELSSKDEFYKKYWNTRYRLESIVELEQLIEGICIDETYKKITCPVFNGYYYKDEENQDKVVSVCAIREMHQKLGTADNLKVEKAFPNAGAHVIASAHQSAAVPEVRSAVFNFAVKILKLKPIEEEISSNEH